MGKAAKGEDGSRGEYEVGSVGKSRRTWNLREGDRYDQNTLYIILKEQVRMFLKWWRL